jgi:hypothetical protein
MKNIVPFLFILFAACSGPKNQSTKQSEISGIDSAISFLINSTWVTPKPELEYNSLWNADHDTLAIAICPEYVFSPFGILTSKKELLASSLNVMEIKDSLYKFHDDDSGVPCFSLKYGSSKLIIWFDDDFEASRHSYIIHGKISDPEIILEYGIKVGMTKDDFINTFFSEFPDELRKKYNVIGFISCVTDIVHIYTFKAERLVSVAFEPG